MQHIHQRKKRCHICNELFQPDRRLKSRQYVCSNPDCQKKRKALNRIDWLKRHPDYFKGQYPRLRLWLEKHADYLRHYRKTHPEKVQADNESRKQRHQREKIQPADIQVPKSLKTLILQRLTPKLTLPQNADIQDSIWPQVVEISILSASYLFADIQDSTDFSPDPPYPPRHDPKETPPSRAPTPPDELLLLPGPPPAARWHSPSPPVG